MQIRIRLFLFSIIFYAGVQAVAQGPNQLLPLSKDYQLDLVWQGDSLNGVWEPNAYLLLPVRLRGCDRQFYMQFDLGAPSSLFYSGMLQAIRAKYPKAVPLADSSALSDFSFSISGMPVTFKQIIVRPTAKASLQRTGHRKSGRSQSRSRVPEVIGTIGSDLIDNHVAVLDYPSRKLLIASAIPAALASQVELTSFIYAQRSVLLPSTVKGKPTLLFFDTGSSAYELLTDKKTIFTLNVIDTVPLQHRSRSWDRMLTANTYEVSDTVQMAGVQLPLLHASFIEGAGTSQVERMMKLGIGGMTGNKLFLQSVLVLDTRNKKFGIARRG